MMDSKIGQSFLSADAPVFVPRGFQNGGVSAQPQMVSETQDPVKVLKSAMSRLIQNPDQFEQVMQPLSNELSATIKEESQLTNAVEEIFNQAIALSNFRYTGAKICDYLSHTLRVQFANGNFRQHLLRRCQEEHQKREDLVTDFATRLHLVGFTNFLGELLLVMKTGEGNQRIPSLATTLQELLCTQLNHPCDQTFRCVVQVIKLTGPVLEEVEKENNKEGKSPQLDDVFSQIKLALVDSAENRSIRNMLLSVLELRASNWGAVSNSSRPAAPAAAAPPPQQFIPPPEATEQVQQQPSPYYQQEGPPQQMYNQYYPDQGGMYGGDPAQFAQQWSNPDEYGYWSESSSAVEDPNFDDEIAAAYEQFLEFNKK